MPSSTSLVQYRVDRNTQSAQRRYDTACPVAHLFSKETHAHFSSPPGLLGWQCSDDDVHVPLGRSLQGHTAILQYRAMISQEGNGSPILSGLELPMASLQSPVR